MLSGAKHPVSHQSSTRISYLVPCLLVSFYKKVTTNGHRSEAYVKVTLFANLLICEYANMLICESIISKNCKLIAKGYRLNYIDKVLDISIQLFL